MRQCSRNDRSRRSSARPIIFSVALSEFRGELWPLSLGKDSRRSYSCVLDDRPFRFCMDAKVVEVDGSVLVKMPRHKLTQGMRIRTSEHGEVPRLLSASGIGPSVTVL